MGTITISKKEYRELTEKKLRYEYLRRLIEEDVFSPPPTKSKKAVIVAFSKTNRYNEKFLKSLEKGLHHSSHFTKA